MTTVLVAAGTLVLVLVGAWRLRVANRKLALISAQRHMERQENIPKEATLRNKYQEWDENDVSEEQRQRQLKEMLDAGELPSYMDIDDVNDPEWVRELVESMPDD